jgi:hypothetical protein
MVAWPVQLLGKEVCVGKAQFSVQFGDRFGGPWGNSHDSGGHSVGVRCTGKESSAVCPAAIEDASVGENHGPYIAVSGGLDDTCVDSNGQKKLQKTRAATRPEAPNANNRLPARVNG